MSEFKPTHTLIAPVEYNGETHPAGTLIECTLTLHGFIAVTVGDYLIPTSWDNLLVINPHTNFSTEDTYNE